MGVPLKARGRYQHSVQPIITYSKGLVMVVVQCFPLNFLELEYMGDNILDIFCFYEVKK